MSNDLALSGGACAQTFAESPNTCPILLTSASGKVTTVSLAPTATMADVEAAVRELAALRRRGVVSLTVHGYAVGRATRVGDVYAACKSADGLLHVHFTLETRLGGSCATPCACVSTGNGGGESNNPFDSNLAGGNDGLLGEAGGSLNDGAGTGGSSGTGGTGGTGDTSGIGGGGGSIGGGGGALGGITVRPDGTITLG